MLQLQLSELPKEIIQSAYPECVSPAAFPVWPEGELAEGPDGDRLLRRARCRLVWSGRLSGASVFEATVLCSAVPGVGPALPRAKTRVPGAALVGPACAGAWPRTRHDPSPYPALEPSDYGTRRVAGGLQSGAAAQVDRNRRASASLCTNVLGRDAGVAHRIKSFK